MSYLRPTCSDAAARATNLGLSRFIPALRSGDEDGTIAGHTDSSNLFDAHQRLPSRRPIDRRWDESRGLVISRKANTMRNHTWTPSRGIVFARGFTQSRGYATRPSAGIPKPVNSVPSGSNDRFGSAMPSMERPDIPSPTAAAKAPKQSEYDRQMKEKDAHIQSLSKKIEESKDRCLDLQVQISDIQEEHKQKREEVYAKGMKDGAQKSNETLELKTKELEDWLTAEKADLKTQGESLRNQMESMGLKQAKFAEQYPDLEKKWKQEAEEERARLEEAWKTFENKKDSKYRELNELKENAARKDKEIGQKYADKERELQLEENRILHRKSKRRTYKTYKAIHTAVQDASRELEDQFAGLEFSLQDEIATISSSSEASAKIQSLGDLRQRVADMRQRMKGTMLARSRPAHVSRLHTNQIRYLDTSMRAETMKAQLYTTLINPLRAVKAYIDSKVADARAQIEIASNATLKEELGKLVDSLLLQRYSTMDATDLAFINRDILAYQILKTEPYSHKAHFMSTIHYRNALDFENSRVDVGKSRLTYNAEWQKRDFIEGCQAARKLARFLEITGQHADAEKEIDKAIDAKIAELHNKLGVTLDRMHGIKRQAYKNAPATLRHAKPASSASTARKSGFTSQIHRKPRSPVEKKLYRQWELEFVRLKKWLTNSENRSDVNLRAENVASLNDLKVKMTKYRLTKMRAKLVQAQTSPWSHSSLVLQAEQSTLEGKLNMCQFFLANAIDPTNKTESGRRWKAHMKANGPVIKSGSNSETLEDGPVAREEASSSEDQLATSSASITQLTSKQLSEKLSELRPKLNHAVEPYHRKALEHEIADLKYIRAKSIKASTSRRLEELGPKTEENAAEHEMIVHQLATQTRRERIAKRKGASLANPRPSGFRAKVVKHLNLSPSPRRESAHSFHSDAFRVSASLRERERTDGAIEPWTSALQQSTLPAQVDATAATEDNNAPNEQRECHNVSAVPSSEHTDACGVSGTSAEAASDDDCAKSHVHEAPSASLSPETLDHPTSTSTSHNNPAIPAHPNAMPDPEPDHIPKYEISASDKRNALIASRNSTASFWRYDLYKNAAGQPPSRHYCTNYEQTEAQLASLLREKVVGFDLEWEKFQSKPGEDSAKRCVSLIQIAAEDKVALFHLAVFRGGDSTQDLISPSMRSFLEDPEIIKVGVNIGGDATRLRNCFGIEMRGNIELSHLYKLVTFGETQPTKVNRALYNLASQVQEILHLPLAKGTVRTSSWSRRLNNQQVEYAASDAYAGLQLYYELERRRKAMESKPPRPAFYELGLPIMLGGDQLPPKAKRGKPPVAESVDEPNEEPTAFQDEDLDPIAESVQALEEDVQTLEEDDSSDDFFDAPEDVAALEAYAESQDAAAGVPLPAITYPSLPSLPSFSSQSSMETNDAADDDNSSLPSDPLSGPPPKASTFASPEAATADAWAADRLTSHPETRVSRAALRGYHLWHHQHQSLTATAALLRTDPPLALSTVVSYVAECLQKENLPFDAERVRQVCEKLPASVRGRYGKLFAKVEKGGGSPDFYE